MDNFIDDLKRIMSLALKTKNWYILDRLETSLVSFLEMDDLNLEYEIMLKFMINMYKLAVTRDFEDLDFSYETLEKNIQINLKIEISNFKSTKRSMDNYSLNYNLKYMSERTQFCEIVAKRTLDLYEELRDLEIEENIQLADNILDDLVENVRLFKIQELIFSVRDEYNKGTKSDKLISMLTSSISSLDIADKKDDQPDSTERSRKLRRSGITLKRIGDFGITGYDLDIYNNDIVSIIGGEGIGKTNLMCNIATDFLMKGHNVRIYRGESQEYKIRFMLLANYISKKYGKNLDWKELLNMDMPETLRQTVDLWEEEFFDKLQGKIFYSTFVDVPSFTETCIKDAKTNKVSVLFVDHVGDLMGGKFENDSARIANYYRQQKVLKDKNIMTFINLAHTGFEESKGRDKGIRKGAGSGSVTKDADIAIQLYQDDKLKKQGLMEVRPLKVREYQGKRIVEKLVKMEMASRYEVVESAPNEFTSILKK